MTREERQDRLRVEFIIFSVSGEGGWGDSTLATPLTGGEKGAGSEMYRFLAR